MDRNTIVAERPAHGCYLTDQTVGSLYRLWLPILPGERAACVTLVNAGGYWYSWQPLHIAVGLPKACTFFPYGHAAFGFPDGVWLPVTTGDWVAWYRHNVYNPNRRLVWTADANYDYVAVNMLHSGSFADATLTLTGSGTLLRATLDCHTAASPFIAASGESSKQVQQRFVTVAERVSAGDTLTIRTTDGGQIRVSTIIGINAQMRDPADGHALLLNANILNGGEPGSDGNVIALQGLESPKGITCALRIEDTANPAGRYWGTPEHTDTNNKITGAGGAGNPTFAWTYFDGDNPNGATWSPAVGARLSAQAFLLTVTGEAKMFGSQVGTYKEWHRFDPNGVSTRWQIDIATPTAGLALVNGGYGNMLTLIEGIGFVEAPGTVDRTALVLSDGTMTGRTYGHRLLLWGKLWKDVALDYVAYPMEPASGMRVMVSERSADNKLYAEYLTPGGTDLALPAGTILSGGGRFGLIPYVPEPPAAFFPHRR